VYTFSQFISRHDLLEEWVQFWSCRPLLELDRWDPSERTDRRNDSSSIADAQVARDAGNMGALDRLVRRVGSRIRIIAFQI
jgi:hypothetical protein